VNPREAATVLGVACAYDQRLNPPTDADAVARSAAWSEALSDMPVDFAIQTVVAHYAASTEAVMPAHLNAAWKRHTTRESEKAQSRALRQAEGTPMPESVRLALTHREETA
jgi:hypothetical protein